MERKAISESLGKPPFDVFPLSMGRRGQMIDIYINQPGRKNGVYERRYDAATTITGIALRLTYEEWRASMDRKIKRGDMFYAELTQGVGSEQSGLRPVLIVQNDTGNKHSGTVIVAPITSKTERKYIMPTHCRIQAMYGLPRVSYILLEQLHTIDKSRLQSYIGTLNAKHSRKVNKALAVSVGLKS